MKPYFAAFLLALATAVQAEETLKFSIKQYRVEGNSVLTDARIQAALQPFTGDGRDFADVQHALEAIEALYRKAGYGASQVYLPEQEMNQGTILFKVVEPKLGKVRIEGNQYFGEGNIRRALPALREGMVPNTGEMAESLRLANENPARRAVVTLQAGDTPQTVDANVKISDEKPWRLFTSLDNTGSDDTGDTRLSLGFQHSNMFDLDQVLTAQATTSPEKTSKVKIFGLGYKIPFYTLGDSLSLFAGYSNVESGALQGLFNVSGKGTVAGARYTQALPSMGALQQRLAWGVDWRRFETETTINTGASLSGNRYHIQPISLAYLAQWQHGRGSYDGNISLSRNIPSGRNLNTVSGRSVAKNGYAIARLGGNAYLNLPADWVAHAAIAGQFTPDALPSGEQFGLGGASSVRGYDERALSNDEGYSLNLEAYTPDFGARTGWNGFSLRGLIFLDWGKLHRNHALPAELSESELAGAGIGVRLGWGKNASLKLDIAQALKDGATQKRNDTKAHFSAVVSY